ncbi:MAG: DUF4956 domain-containing protein [Bacteroidetes bacterium]|nr:DUF4956 domain-containing protein [Bacteroidota bacterium]
MEDFLSLYSKIENPTVEMVFFTFLLSFILGVAIAVIYTKTTPNTIKTPNFVQALILSSIIAATVIQATNNSIASGLGILGALTILNFRTNFRDPRDIIFMFAAISTGIACGSYVFLIAIIGISGFGLVAIILSFTPFYLGNHLIWELRLRFDKLPEKEKFVEETLDHYCRKFNNESIRNDVTKDNIPFLEYEYVVILKDDGDTKKLITTLELGGVIIRKFNKQNTEFTSND